MRPSIALSAPDHVLRLPSTNPARVPDIDTHRPGEPGALGILSSCQDRLFLRLVCLILTAWPLLLYPVPTAAHACPRSSIPSSLGVSNHITQPPFPRCTPHLDFAGLLALLAGRRRWRPGPGPGPGSGSGSAQVVLLSGSGFAHLPLHH